MSLTMNLLIGRSESYEARNDHIVEIDMGVCREALYKEET